MATHATHNDWIGSWCDVAYINVVMEEQNGQMIATTRTEHQFTAYNNSGKDQRDVKCEYNHTVNIWDEGLNKWTVINRDAPERGFDVDEDNSYNHHDFQRLEGVAFVRTHQFVMQPNRRYQIDVYTAPRLPKDNLKDTKFYEFSTPEY